MRKQRAFASLSEAELHQVAEWVRAQKYDDVIARVAQSRPEGFGLTVSRKPLQLLFAKVSRLDKINALLTTGRKLTLSDLDQIEAGEKSDHCEQAHDAILIATHEIATSEDSNPTQLLALQRLADFPARAELREHKIQMDLARKEFAQQRLEIQKSHLARAEKLAEKKLRAESAPTKRTEDHLGPFARNWDDISERARIHFGVSKEEWARRTGANEEKPHLEETQFESAEGLCTGSDVPTSSLSNDFYNGADAASERPDVSLSQQGTPIREANVSNGETNSGRALPRSGSSLPLFSLREAIGLGEGFNRDTTACAAIAHDSCPSNLDPSLSASSALSALNQNSEPITENP